MVLLGPEGREAAVRVADRCEAAVRAADRREAAGSGAPRGDR